MTGKPLSPAAAEFMGGISVLINNAGIGTAGNIETETYEKLAADARDRRRLYFCRHATGDALS